MRQRFTSQRLTVRRTFASPTKVRRCLRNYHRQCGRVMNAFPRGRGLGIRIIKGVRNANCRVRGVVFRDGPNHCIATRLCVPRGVAIPIPTALRLYKRKLGNGNSSSRTTVLVTSGNVTMLIMSPVNRKRQLRLVSERKGPLAQKTAARRALLGTNFGLLNADLTTRRC